MSEGSLPKQVTEVSSSRQKRSTTVIIHTHTVFVTTAPVTKVTTIDIHVTRTVFVTITPLATVIGRVACNRGYTWDDYDNNCAYNWPTFSGLPTQTQSPDYLY
ncbi:unnamed protein product [Meganyctiphanes norvegica]|uniref:Uncharacterized protein n=1 Tax=Meganyctiphanes norvegica TaxID=48144 RepID=A0AAV2SIB1_MEGNR